MKPIKVYLELKARSSRRRKTGGALLLAMLYGFLAEAWILIVIGILCLIAGAYAIYKFMQVINHWIPPVPDQNRNKNYQWTATNSVSNMPPVVIDGPQVSKILPVFKDGTCTLQYCVYYDPDMRSFTPWMSMGSNYAESAYGCTNVIIDTTDENAPFDRYAVATIYEGSAFYVDSTFTWDGLPIGEPIVKSFSPNTVEIQRSDDLVKWEYLYTDYNVATYAVRTFVDQNAPPEKAFYRIKVTVGEPVLDGGP